MRPRITRAFAGLFALTVLASAEVAPGATPARTWRPDAVNRAMQDRDYRQAIERIDARLEELADVDDPAAAAAEREVLLYRRGLALL